MEEVREKSFSEMTAEEVADRLSFLDSDYVKFWMNNPDFRLEYKRLYEFGIEGKFYRFCLAAENVVSEMQLAVDPEFDFDTAIKSIRVMTRLLHSQYDDRLYDRKLLFMVNKLSAPYPSIKYWLSIPEFVDEMQERVDRRELIDDNVALESMERIYSQKIADRERICAEQQKNTLRIGFNFRLAKQAIKSIKKSLGIATE